MPIWRQGQSSQELSNSDIDSMPANNLPPALIKEMSEWGGSLRDAYNYASQGIGSSKQEQEQELDSGFGRSMAAGG